MVNYHLFRESTMDSSGCVELYEIEPTMFLSNLLNLFFSEICMRCLTLDNILFLFFPTKSYNQPPSKLSKPSNTLIYYHQYSIISVCAIGRLVSMATHSMANIAQLNIYNYSNDFLCFSCIFFIIMKTD